MIMGIPWIYSSGKHICSGKKTRWPFVEFWCTGTFQWVLNTTHCLCVPLCRSPSLSICSVFLWDGRMNPKLNCMQDSELDNCHIVFMAGDNQILRWLSICALDLEIDSHTGQIAALELVCIAPEIQQCFLLLLQIMGLRLQSVALCSSITDYLKLEPTQDNSLYWCWVDDNMY